jgi:hypothetical protein
LKAAGKPVELTETKGNMHGLNSKISASTFQPDAHVPHMNTKKSKRRIKHGIRVILQQGVVMRFAYLESVARLS